MMLSTDFVQRDPDILGGTPVFAGTRVPIETMFDYLDGGQSLDDFLEDYPTVEPGQARGLLRSLRERVAVA
jgi:uncharacterized protein (DUF433 family)